MSDQDLKACAHCGGEAKRGQNFGREAVNCTACPVSIRGDFQQSFEEVAAAWNARAPLNTKGVKRWRCGFTDGKFCGMVANDDPGHPGLTFIGGEYIAASDIDGREGATEPNWGRCGHGVTFGYDCQGCEGLTSHATPAPLEGATPETDAAINRTIPDGADWAEIAWDFARDLERRLMAAGNYEGQHQADQQTIRYLRAEIQARAAKDSGEFWYWQGDGTDNLETLTCPVLIHAAQLRAIASPHKEAPAGHKKGDV